MNEVEKMYENAGIKLKAECTSKVCIVTNPHKDWCNKCESLKHDYPPFTAEKQLSLIKFLLDKYCDIRIRKNLEGDYYIKSFNDISCFSEDFEETLASFTNTHLKDLTDAERTQIRNILESEVRE